MEHNRDKERLTSLKNYNLLNIDLHDETYSAFNLWMESVVLACKVPMGNIAMFHEDKIHFISEYGFKAKIARVSEFPGFEVLLNGEFYEVEDIRKDEIFKNFSGFINHNIQY